MDELRQMAAEINIAHSEKDLLLIEQLRQQFNSKHWYRFRAGRVTASLFYSVCRTSLIKGSDSLIDRICWPEKHIFSTIQTNYGQKHESIARNDYANQQSRVHQQLSVTNTGLVVNKNYPYFGASSDGIVICICCGQNTLEIKCPFKPIRITENAVYVAKEKIPAIIENRNGELVMNEVHYFYYQVPMQLILSDVQYSDFYIWQKESSIQVRVPRNDSFWQYNYPKAVTFF